MGEILPGQQQNQQSGLGLVQQQQQHQQHHHLSSCMSTMQLKSTAERDNRRNHQVYTSSPVKQENHKSNDHGSGLFLSLIKEINLIKKKGINDLYLEIFMTFMVFYILFVFLSQKCTK